MMNTEKTDKTASVRPENVRFGASFIGCVLDCSCGPADYCNERTIDFAKSYGFEAGEMPDEENEDYGQILSETGDDAVSWLNDQDNLPYCSWYFEDNSLFYGPSIEMAREDVGFISSRENEYPSDDYEGDWLHVNDHGNATLYVRDDKGEDTEVWGIV
jgi:hypothetical protein